MGDSLLAPPVASIAAQRTDLIFLALLVVSGAIVLLVTLLIVVFSVRYRDGSSAPRRRLEAFISRDLEIGWTLATLLAFLFIFGWATVQDFQLLGEKTGALTIQVIGKQWMWKGGTPEDSARSTPSTFRSIRRFGSFSIPKT